MTEKVCRVCGETKPIENFGLYWNNQRNKHYRMANCRNCRNEKKRDEWKRKSDEHSVARRKRYAEDPEYRRELLSRQHKYRHGITLEEKEALLAAQGGVCDSCREAVPKGHGWTTDHDHACCPGDRSCGKCIRAILCTNCNLALGHVNDSIEKLENLIEYTRRHSRIIT